MTLLTWVFFDDALIVEAAVSVLFGGQDNNVFVYRLSPISLKSCLSTNRTRINPPPPSHLWLLTSQLILLHFVLRLCNDLLFSN